MAKKPKDDCLNRYPQMKVVNPFSAWYGHIGKVVEVREEIYILQFPDGTKCSFGSRELQTAE